MISEIKIKEGRLAEFMIRNRLDGLLISKRSNFAWLTCGGDNHVMSASDVGVASILVIRKPDGIKKFVLTDNIESMRIKEEELKNQNFIYEKNYWYKGKIELTNMICKGLKKVGTDTPYPKMKIYNLAELHRPLVKEEVARFKLLGRESAEAMKDVLCSCKSGMTENMVAGLVADNLISRGIEPVVILIASDKRIFKYRHPIPTDKKIKKYLMIVFCAQKWGLVASMTRFVHFGPLPKEIKRKQMAVVEVDAEFLLESVCGNSLGEIFRKAKRVYEEVGFPDEWKLHHQGGPTGYLTREFRVNDSSEEVLVEARALAWNPSITGTKSEDTIITSSSGPIILTDTGNWCPAIKVKRERGEILRPDILVK